MFCVCEMLHRFSDFLLVEHTRTQFWHFFKIKKYVLVSMKNFDFHYFIIFCIMFHQVYNV
jgi:hypothetical protein